jgi:L-amino acid N-acyltransferase YncA
VRCLIREAEAAGIDVVVAQTTGSNLAARALLARLGFTVGVDATSEAVPARLDLRSREGERER